METLIDQQLKNFERLKFRVMIENDHQLSKWGIQVRTPFEWMTYLTEEVGELAEAISEEHYRKGTKSDVIKEAIQVATLALKIAEAYEFQDD